MRITRKRNNCARTASATVELAVCLPVIAVLVFGSLAATTMIFLRAAAVQSAYEVVREAVKVDGDVNLALQRGRAVLEFRNVDIESITLNPANVQAQPQGTPITATVVTNTANAGVLGFGPFGSRRVEAQAVMMKE